MTNEVALIQIINGSDAGARAVTGFTDAHRTGGACLFCDGTENVTTKIGYVGGNAVKVHSYQQEQWRMGDRTAGAVEMVRAPHVPQGPANSG